MVLACQGATTMWSSAGSPSSGDERNTGHCGGMFTSLGIAIFILVLAVANLGLGFAVAWYLRQVRVEIAWPSKARDVQQEIAKVAAHAGETHAAKAATPVAAATNHAPEANPATLSAAEIAAQ